MTPYEANHYFETLPEGFALAEELRAALPAAVQQVQFVGVAGTAGKTATAGLLGAILQAAGFVTGLYHAGCEPLAARIRVQGAPVDEVLFREARKSCLLPSLCPAPLQSWPLPPFVLARQAVSWLWWSCRMPVWQRLCPPCRSAR